MEDKQFESFRNQFNALDSSTKEIIKSLIPRDQNIDIPDNVCSKCCDIYNSMNIVQRKKVYYFVNNITLSALKSINDDEN